VEFAEEFGLPLLRKLWRAKDSQALCLTPIYEFTGYKTGFDGLADADVIRYQYADSVLLESHQ